MVACVFVRCLSAFNVSLFVALGVRVVFVAFLLLILDYWYKCF